MKKKAIAVLGLAVMLMTTNVIGVFAADNKDASSSATFELQSGGGTVTPPVDPEEPDENIDPDDEDEDGGGSTGNTGALRIDYVSNYKFGTHSIEAGEQIFNAELVSANNGTHKVPNYVQVSDLRGEKEGWALSVQQDQFKVVGNATETMDGAQIVLKNITPNTVNAVKAEVAPGNIVLNGNNAPHLLMKAAEEVGYGTHVAYFGDYNKGDEESAKESVQLVIPEGTERLKAKYKSVLTWTLADAPTGDFEQ